MAAWKRKGGVGHLRDRLVDGMRERGYSGEFAEAIFRQIEGFGEYGFPESHAASFALLVYISAWLKRHEPAAFLAGLLNAQPMGFYSAAQLVQDARRHGVEVHPPDVQHSAWESAPEAGAPSSVRIGLNQIRGLGAEAGMRIARVRPFGNAADLARRAALSRSELDTLAAAGALASLAGHRREAAWAVAAVPVQRDLLSEIANEEEPARLPPPNEGENIVADYATLSLTLGRHPLALLRTQLARRRYVPASTLRELGHNAPARCAGIVTHRQRPGSAAGAVFLTLEDETGLINVIVSPRLVERQRRELLGARLLGVLGVLQREGEVAHLIAKRLVDHTPLLGELPTRSRDFQ
jgi:error-prone DNA polymerase